MTRRRLELVPLAAVHARRVEWLWKGRIPVGEVTLLAGPEGTGKSTMLAHLAAEVTRGRLEGDRQSRPLAACFAALEDDDASTLRPRLEAAGANLDLVATVRVSVDERTPGALRLPEDTAALAERMSAGVGSREVGLLVIDPIKSAGVGSLKDDTEVRALLSPLVDLAQRAGIAVVVSGHFKKGAKDEDFAAWKVSGSPAWTQVPRSVLFFDHDPEEDHDETARIIAHAKCNLARRQPTLKARVVTEHVPAAWGAMETSRLILGGESAITAGEMRSQSVEVGAKAEAKAWLAQYLSDGREHERSEIVVAAEAEGIATRTLDRARKSLAVTVRRFGAGESAGSAWQLDVGASGMSGTSEHAPGRTPATLATPATSPQAQGGTAAAAKCACDHPLSAPDDGGVLRCVRCGGQTDGWGVAA